MNKLLSWKRLWERKPEGSLCSEAWRWLPVSRVFSIQAAEGCRCAVSSSAGSRCFWGSGSWWSGSEPPRASDPLCYLSAGIASIPVFDLQINDFKPSSSAVGQRGPSFSAATPLGVQIHEKNPDRNKEKLTSAAK